MLDFHVLDLADEELGLGLDDAALRPVRLASSRYSMTMSSPFIAMRLRSVVGDLRRVTDSVRNDFAGENRRCAGRSRSALQLSHRAWRIPPSAQGRGRLRVGGGAGAAAAAVLSRSRASFFSTLYWRIDLYWIRVSGRR